MIKSDFAICTQDYWINCNTISPTSNTCVINFINFRSPSSIFKGRITNWGNPIYDILLKSGTITKRIL